MPECLNRDDFNEIRSWVHRNARPLELSLWKCHFEGGSKENALNELAFYQNSDGGFGNVLEPDNWNPESTPYNTEFAVGILRRIGFTDISHPVYQGIFRFLKNTQYRGENGWFFNVPANDLYPHAVWWNYSEEGNIIQNIGLTASLSGFILRYANVGDELYGAALEYADMLLEKLKTDDSCGDMGISGYCSLFCDLKTAGLESRFDLDFLENKTRSLIKAHFHEYVWTHHQDMAVMFPEPSLYYYGGYEQAVSDSLDELVKIRPEGGVWGIPWEWYDGGVYAKEFAISENWWKSFKAIEKLLFLKAYGRLVSINN